MLGRGQVPLAPSPRVPIDAFLLTPEDALLTLVALFLSIYCSYLNLRESHFTHFLSCLRYARVHVSSETIKNIYFFINPNWEN